VTDLKAEWSWKLFSKTLVALPIAIAIWVPFLFGSLRVVRPLVELAASLVLGNVVAGLVQAGPLEWTLQTNLAFADKPQQLYELPVQPQYFLLPFPLIWASVWVSTTVRNRIFYLMLATAIGLGATLIPLLLQVIPAPAVAAHSIGLDAVVNRSVPPYFMVERYHPAPSPLLQMLAFIRSVIVYFNLFILPPFLCILGAQSEVSGSRRGTRVAPRLKHARRSR
jgi:hypothetical protein